MQRKYNENDLLNAIRKRSVKDVEKILEQKKSENNIDLEFRKDNQTALLYAISTYNYLQLSDLFTQSADESFKIIKLLLENNANPNAQNKQGDTPLLLALNKNHVDGNLIFTLIKHGADIFQKNNKNNAPCKLKKEYVSWECEEKWQICDIVIHLIQVLKEDSNNEFAKQTLKKIIEQLSNINSSIYHLLLSNSDSTYFPTKDDIYLACDYIIKNKLDDNLNRLDYLSRTPLHLLINKFINSSCDSEKKFKYNFIDFAKLLIENNADANLRDKNNKTPTDLLKEMSFGIFCITNNDNKKINMRNELVETLKANQKIIIKENAIITKKFFQFFGKNKEINSDSITTNTFSKKDFNKLENYILLCLKEVEKKLTFKIPKYLKMIIMNQMMTSKITMNRVTISEQYMLHYNSSSAVEFVENIHKALKQYTKNYIEYPSDKKENLQKNIIQIISMLIEIANNVSKGQRLSSKLADSTAGDIIKFLFLKSNIPEGTINEYDSLQKSEELRTFDERYVYAQSANMIIEFCDACLTGNWTNFFASDLGFVREFLTFGNHKELKLFLENKIELEQVLEKDRKFKQYLEENQELKNLLENKSKITQLLKDKPELKKLLRTISRNAEFYIIDDPEEIEYRSVIELDPNEMPLIEHEPRFYPRNN